MGYFMEFITFFVFPKEYIHLVGYKINSIADNQNFENKQQTKKN